jgi:hypothetical protein
MRVDPSGVSAAALAILKQATEQKGFAKVGRVHTVYGDVFIAEKFTGAGWDVLWVARDMAQHIECYRETSSRARQQAAVDSAYKNLKFRNGVAGN